MSPRRQQLQPGTAVVDPVVVSWPVELGYDGEALCARCLQPLRGPDGLRLGGGGSVTTVEWILRSVGDHFAACPDRNIEIEYHDHEKR